MRHLKSALLALTLLTPLTAPLLPAHAAGTLRIGTQEEPDRLDPALGGTFGGRFVFTAMCDKLWDLKPDLTFAPQLATTLRPLVAGTTTSPWFRPSLMPGLV